MILRKKIINIFNENKAEEYCSGCAPELAKKIMQQVRAELESLRKELKKTY